MVWYADMRVGEYQGVYQGGFECSIYNIGDSDPDIYQKGREFLGNLWFASVPRVGEVVRIPEPRQWNSYKVMGVVNHAVKLELGTSSRAADPTLLVQFIEKVEAG